MERNTDKEGNPVLDKSDLLNPNTPAEQLRIPQMFLADYSP